MAMLRKLYSKLRCKVNETKSAQPVCSVSAVSWVQSLAGSERGRQAQGCDKSSGQVQAPNPEPDPDPSQCRTKHAAGRRSATPVHSWLEGLLPTGANARGLARAGPMDTSPVTGHQAQAMEAWQDHVPGTHRHGGQSCASAQDCRKLTAIVAQQREVPQWCSDDCVL